MFSFNEVEFYSWALRAGVQNLLKNRCALGWKRTLGKILQPINSLTRFPEYFLMAEAIRRHVSDHAMSVPLRVLDVGSPKCFGLYLACRMNIDIELTDISSTNVDQYQIMWDAIRSAAKGKAQFSIQDARSMHKTSKTFDIVYSMSVLEHIEGERGDAEGVGELFRVLKPGGLLLLSVPFGNKYVEQVRRGLSGASEKRTDDAVYFFQRVYDAASLETRLGDSFRHASTLSIWSIWREHPVLARRFMELGENVRGALGFVNPWLSVWINRCEAGIKSDIPCLYGGVHSPGDIYGDIVIAAQKPLEGQPLGTALSSTHTYLPS